MYDIAVFDFDGVVCDSTEECLITSFNTWQRIHDDPTFVLTPDSIPPDLASFFRSLRQYVRAAGEYYTLYRAREEHRPIDSQAGFEALNQEWSPELKRFEERFFEVRNVLRSRDLSAWVHLHLVYEQVVEVLEDMAKREKAYIVTLKDRASVTAILHEFGVEIAPNNIVDKGEVRNKIDGIKRIGTMLDCPLPKIAFIDDNVTHLLEPHEAGVACYLAAWGYHTHEHLMMAEKEGIPLLSLENLPGLFQEGTASLRA